MYRFHIKYVALLSLLFLAFSLSSQSIGGTTSGAASYCSSTNSGFISVSSYTGNILYWQESTNGGASWANIGNVTPNQSYFNLTQTTCYRAVVQNGVAPADTSSFSCITIYPPTVPGILSIGGNFCGATGTGTLTLSGNTGNVLNWQYSTDGGLTWVNVANTATALTYTNITQNTIYEAVVQNTSFCAIDTSTQAAFTIDPPTVPGTLSIAANDSVCFAVNSGTLTLSGNTGQVIGWLSSTNNGATWSPITNTTTTQTFSNLLQNTLYEVIVQSGACPPDTSGSQGVTVLALPTVSAGNDTTISPGQSATLNGSGSGTPFWIPVSGLSNPAIFNPVATPTVTTAYVLVVTGFFSCLNADTVLVIVDQPVFNGTVSTYFSPNGDGINDNWYIQNIQAYPDNEVFVYNIYGNEVYTKKGYANDWKGTYNGSDLPDGTYYYVLKFDTGKLQKGSLDIIRKN